MSIPHLAQHLSAWRNLTSVALLCFAPQALAQEPLPPLPVGPQPAQEGAEDPKQKMIRLFGEVQKHLDEIDRLLLEASTKRSAEEITEALRKMEELLRDAERNQSSTIEKMDELIKTAPQQQSGSGKGPPKKNQPPQEGQGQPQDQKPSQDPGQQGERDQRSDRPQQLDRPQGEQGEKPEGSKPESEQDQKGQQNPNSNRDSDEAGSNIEGPDSSRRSGAQRDDPRGSWEVQLPPKKTEVFRNPLRDTQIPDRYHRWIERWRTRSTGGRGNG